MVAEAQKPAVNRKGRPPGATIPVFVRLKARNLYLSQGLGYQAIAVETGMRYESVRNLSTREGWPALRKKQKVALNLASDANAQAMQSEVLESIASLSEQHAIRSLDRVGDALERTDENAARDAQSYSGCLRNLVNVARDIRRPEMQVSEGARLNVFVLRVGDQAKPAQAALEAAPKEINVTASAANSGATDTLSANKSDTP